MKAANGISLIAIPCGPDRRVIDASAPSSHPDNNGCITKVVALCSAALNLALLPRPALRHVSGTKWGVLM